MTDSDDPEEHLARLSRALDRIAAHNGVKMPGRKPAQPISEREAVIRRLDGLIAQLRTALGA